MLLECWFLTSIYFVFFLKLSFFLNSLLAGISLTFTSIYYFYAFVPLTSAFPFNFWRSCISLLLFFSSVTVSNPLFLFLSSVAFSSLPLHLLCLDFSFCFLTFSLLAIPDLHFSSFLLFIPFTTTCPSFLAFSFLPLLLFSLVLKYI